MGKEIFTIEDGDEILEIEADSPEEALSFIQSQKQAAKPPTGVAEMPLGEALIQNTPLAPGIRDLAKGQYTQGMDKPDITGRVAGDLGAASGIGASLMTAGGPATLAGIGLGAGLGALFEKTGASPALRHEASVIRDRAPKVPAFISGERQPRKAWEFAKSIGAQIPNEAGATALELGPSVMSSIGTGLGLKGAAALKARPQMGKAPGAAGLLQEQGGKITPAMEQFAKTGQRRGMAPAVENLSRANPLTSGMLERVDKANTAAIQKLSKERIPQGFNTGDALGSVLEDFQKTRGSRIEAAKGAVKGLPPVKGSAPGKAASDAIIKILQENEVPSDAKGFNPSKMTRFENMDPATAETLVRVEREVRNAKSPKEMVNYIQNFDKDFLPELQAKYGNAASGAIKQARSLLKVVLEEAVEKQSPDIAGEYRASNQQYARTQPFVKSALEKWRGAESSAKLFDSMFGKSGKHADKALKAFKEGMPPEQFSQVQDTLAAGLIENATVNGNLSLPKLKTALATIGENQKYLKPETRAAFQDVINMMETAGVSELGQPNPSGTGNRTLANWILGATAGAAPWSLVPAAGAGAASGAAALYMKAPQMKAALGKGIKNLPDIPAGQGAAVAGLGASNTENQRKAAERAKRLAKGR